MGSYNERRTLADGERLFQISGTQVMSFTYEIAFTAERLTAIAAKHDVTPDELTVDLLREEIIDDFYGEGLHGLCAHCSGYMQRTDAGFRWSRDETEDDIDIDDLPESVIEIDQDGKMIERR